MNFVSNFFLDVFYKNVFRVIIAICGANLCDFCYISPIVQTLHSILQYLNMSYRFCTGILFLSLLLSESKIYYRKVNLCEHKKVHYWCIAHIWDICQIGYQIAIFCHQCVHNIIRGDKKFRNEKYKTRENISVYSICRPFQTWSLF